MKKAESERWRSFSLWTLRTEEAAHDPKHRRVEFQIYSEEIQRNLLSPAAQQNSWQGFSTTSQADKYL